MVDIKRVGGFENLNPANSAVTKADQSKGASFKEALDSISNGDSPEVSGLSPNQMNGLQSLFPQPKIASLKFSNHAIDRMQSRGVYFNQEELGKIQEAVGRAAAKGSKDSLILTDKAALIVSVKNNTVVTVMDKNALKENVFTNIDSTIVM